MIHSSSDTVGRNALHNNWSYGAGMSVPVGGMLDVFGESRWRMSRYVLPTARFAPTPTNEFRFGISLHLGNAGAQSRSKPRST